MVITVGSKLGFGTQELKQKIEQTENDDEQEIVAASPLEATFSATVFKLSAALVFAFEIYTSVEEVKLPRIVLSSVQATSYWIKLITSTIIVNAP